MFSTICSAVPRDYDLPERAWRLDLLTRVLDGTLYDVLPYEFHDERTESGEYIPLRKRRPSVRYGLARLVVEDSVALVFGEDTFPSLDSSDPLVREYLPRLLTECGLRRVMTEAALKGSVGSVALWLRILKGRVFVEPLETKFLAPVWDPAEPDRLLSVREKYKVSGAELAASGYEVDDLTQEFWFTRIWDADWETWLDPQPVGARNGATVDLQRSIRHGLGFVPFVWIKNLPGGTGCDGACTFRPAIETSIEIDYQLSQAGRGLKYSSDPTLLIKEPAGLEGELVRGAANALVLSEKGDAKLLEIGGTASQAVIDYVRILRELALESVHGNRADASRLSVPASGRALELMNQGLVWLAGSLRLSYGTGGLVPLVKMILRASERYTLHCQGSPLPRLNKSAPISLRWPDWYPPDALDRQRDAQTILELVKARQISRETALRILGPTYDIADPESERQRLRAEGTE